MIGKESTVYLKSRLKMASTMAFVIMVALTGIFIIYKWVFIIGLGVLSIVLTVALIKVDIAIARIAKEIDYSVVEVKKKPQERRVKFTAYGRPQQDIVIK